MEEKSWKDHRAVLNPGEENELEVFGYQTRNLRRALCLLTSVLTCGALLLVFYWKPQWRVWASCIPCPLQEADTVLLRTTDEFQRYTRKKVICLYLSMLKFPISKNPEEPVVADCHSVINQAVLKPELKLRCIQVQKIRYVWDNLEKRFQKVGLLEDSNSCHDIHHTFGLGLTSEEQEVLNPFYVFQAFTLTLWLSQGYIEYSVAIIILSVISIVLSVYDLRQQSVKLHNLVEDHNKVQVTVIVKGKGLQELESRLLVPGDLLILPGKVSLPCDAVLIDGNCVVNEGMLTGIRDPKSEDEDLKVVKVPPSVFLPHCLSSLLGNCIEGPYSTYDYVHVGYNTAKGDLVRSILYPRPLNFKLYSDAFKFIVFLACLGVMGFFYALGVYVYHGVSQRDTAAMALLLLTVTVPAVLPAALTTGIVYAQKRMRKKKIFCISPQRINMCGQINLVCFDKV
ncbi:putative cation-transporting ATPase 13A5 [Camelus dromedarius]|uniref:Cation-transporting ATPase n=1 Tax=Camelus dromedarius TaxID=9838 RepID=A0A5N4EI28_CAMDR|nr:putative cation-transporting ATPase 13A5 [Camelus dromedarius]